MSSLAIARNVLHPTSHLPVDKQSLGVTYHITDAERYQAAAAAPDKAPPLEVGTHQRTCLRVIDSSEQKSKVHEEGDVFQNNSREALRKGVHALTKTCEQTDVTAPQCKQRRRGILQQERVALGPRAGRLAARRASPSHGQEGATRLSALGEHWAHRKVPLINFSSGRVCQRRRFTEGHDCQQSVGRLEN